MTSFDQNIDTRGGRLLRTLSGWQVLFGLIGFFGIIFAVNGVMIYEALSTMSGVDTDSAYQAGRMYEQEVAMAKAQDERRWQIDARVSPSGNETWLDVAARDASGQPLSGLDASAVFERPTDRRLDQGVALTEDSAGRFHGKVTVPPGQWDLVIEFSRRGEQMFKSRNRIVLK